MRPPLRRASASKVGVKTRVKARTKIITTEVPRIQTDRQVIFLGRGKFLSILSIEEKFFDIPARTPWSRVHQIQGRFKPVS